MSNHNRRIHRLAWAGPLAMLLLFGQFAFRGGETWEFGRYGMPHTRLAADGVHLADCRPVSPVDGVLIRAGIEEEFYLTMLVLSGLFTVAAVLVIRSARRKERRLSESRRDEVRSGPRRHAFV